MTWNYTMQFTPEAVYGNVPTIPDGYEVEAFRPPKRGETVILTGRSIEKSPCDFGIYEPRFILRKKAKRRVLVSRREVRDDIVTLGVGPGFPFVGGKYAESLARDFSDIYTIEERD